MSKIPRYLITSSDENTWKFDRPVLFLGEWCRLFNRKHIWKDMDAIVAAPYGIERQTKERDYVLARDLEEKLLPILCNTLNHFHSTQHNDRFWLIVLGHWLRRYVDVIINRVNTVELCLESYNINGISSLSSDTYSLASMNSYAALWAFNDDRWNNALYIRILNLLGVTNCPIEMISDAKSDQIANSIVASEIPMKKRIRMIGYRTISQITGMLTKANDAFIINSYLPRGEVLKLQLVLGQVPQLWSSPKFSPIKNPDLILRKDLSGQIAEAKSSSLFGIICSLIFEILPVCYLEGFGELNKFVQQLPWPKNPKFIFTSNNFDTDDVFKFWAATKVESGSKYIIGQHGNNYGTYRYMWPSIEEKIPDKFLTWGWTDGLPQHTPAFILKTAGVKPKRFDPYGGLLLVEARIPHRINTWDVTFEFDKYFSDQKIFIKELKSHTRKITTIRLHSDYKYFGWSEVLRWKEFDPALKIDTGSNPIEKAIANSRLVVFSYDSTGMLETLSQNIPTLAYWQNDFDHLREKAYPYYQLLVDVGIVHLTPESAANMVNEIWDDIDFWWKQAEVQEARRQFCDQYAKICSKPVICLRKLLLK